MPDTEILQGLRASPPRRYLAAVMLAALAALFLWIGVAEPLAWPWRVAMTGAGGAIGYICWRMWRDTRGALVLTRQGIFTDRGIAVAPLADVVSVDRGAFAFKPSNGFVVRLRRSAAPAWRPGLWWRIGGRIGVGGVTPAAEARAMAEALALLLHERNAHFD